MVLADLPNDVDALKAMIFALSQETKEAQAEIAELKAINATVHERNARLTSIIKMLERSRYGTRSEKLKPGGLDDEQRAFVFDEIETGLAEIAAPLEKKAKSAPRSPRRNRPHTR